MAAKATVKGDREIIANIRRAYNSVGGLALKKNLFDALQPMKEQTEENARERRQPRQPKGGHLDENIVIVKHLSKGPMFFEAWLTFKGRGRKLAHLVEYGTAPHWQPNRGIMHPGARPYPFARPAFEDTKQEVVDMVGKTAWANISSSLVRASKK